MRLMGRMGLMRRARPPKGPTLGTNQWRLLDSVAGHELRHQERTQGVVLLLSIEANLGSRTLRRIGHLTTGVLTRLGEQTSLCQHTGSHHGARIAQLRDIRLLGETVHAEIDIGVAARLTVHSLHGVLKFYLLILGHNS